MILWVVGAPGAGKTTLTRTILNRACSADPAKLWRLNTKPKWTVVKDICAAGHYKGDTFDGGDTVGYNCVEETLDYWEEHLSALPLTIFDGDRFSSENVLRAMLAIGEECRCLQLTASELLLDTRRAERGSKQNAAWMKGRATKASRFVLKFPPLHRVSLDAASPMDYRLLELGKLIGITL